MTYNVFGGMLNFALSICLSISLHADDVQLAYKLQCVNVSDLICVVVAHCNT